MIILVSGLFYLAHDLVDVHSETAIAWLAVGCYYYLIGECNMIIYNNQEASSPVFASIPEFFFLQVRSTVLKILFSL